MMMHHPHKQRGAQQAHGGKVTAGTRRRARRSHRQHLPSYRAHPYTTSEQERCQSIKMRNGPPECKAAHPLLR